MAVFKCKMCGGSLEVQEGQNTCTCEYCGTEQTLPRLDSEKKANLYDRANHFRRNNDYDKAAGIYEQILNEDSTDAEAYWSLVLCRYGIEYVEDPRTHKRIPTVNRAQYTSIYADEDYKAAIVHAEMAQKSVYEREAAAIDEIQRGILTISEKESPYDVFICYKETDEAGRRTQDSVLANDLYHQLVQEGFKVFYAKITLEDKLGQEYEPYIFAALNSAKVMVVLGTKPEYFKAVWVKNEWSRFLALVKISNGKRILIPAYKDMDPYDLPEEFSHLQAQDMSKLGFMQDLIRGIEKLLQKKQDMSIEKYTSTSMQNSGGNIDALITRGKIALEDGEWEKADGFYEEALNIDPKCARAYLGKFLAKEKCVNIHELLSAYAKSYEKCDSDALEACPQDKDHISRAVEEYMIPKFLEDDFIREQYGNNRNYQAYYSNRKAQKERMQRHLNDERLWIRACQYADGRLKEELEENYHRLMQIMDERIEKAKKLDEENKATAIKKYAEFLAQTDLIVKKMNEEAEERRTEEYQHVLKQMNEADGMEALRTVRTYLLEFKGYKDSEALAEECQNKIDEIFKKQEEEKKRLEVLEKERLAKKSRIMKIFALVISFVFCFFIILAILSQIYADAIQQRKELNVIRKAQVGDSVSYGKYEMDGNEGNGKEELQWIILEKTEDQAILITSLCIDAKPYHGSNGISVSWEDCSLREWLNVTFIENAFNEYETKEMVLFQSCLGLDAKDKVSLLSKAEAEKYFPTDGARSCLVSSYARNMIGDTTNYWTGDDMAGWWLLPDGNDGSRWIVNADGSIVSKSGKIFVPLYVRPVIRINIKK